MISKKDAAAELLRRRKARKSLAEYISYTNPRYKRSYFSDMVCAALDKFIEDMQAGRRPILVLQAPPQHGKSEQVSRKLPPYLLGRFPDWRVGAFSYSDDLAGPMSLDVRRNIASDAHARLFPASATRKKYTVNRDGEFSAPGGEGAYIGRGIGSGATGRSLDCLVEGTLIDTNIGRIPIEKLQFAGSSCKVLSYRNGGLTYERIKAFASGKGLGIYRISSKRGRILEVTGNHRFYTSRGYVAANELTQSDVLLSAVRSCTNTNGGGVQEIKSEILFARLRSKSESFRKALRELWNRGQSWPIWKILREMFGCCEINSVSSDKVSPEGCHLPNVPKSLHFGESKKRGVFGILRENLRRSGTCIANDGRRESEVEERRDALATAATFGQSLPDNTSWDSLAGSKYVRFMFRQIITLGGAPYRREPIKQRIVEFSDVVRSLPQRGSSADGWEIEEDGVERIERIREEAPVFDIQVEAACNFFANGILVHNCGIIDDPIKDAKEALSPTTKEAVWNWYQTVFKTRLSDLSGQIIMATSWAEDDLSARVMKLHAGDGRLTVLKFPAINEPGEAGYNPELPKGALVPELHSMAQLLEFKAEMSDYWWSALYQQSPKSLGGNVFKDVGLRYYLPKDLPAKFDKVLASWDCTFKDTDGTDFVVGQVWGKAGANSYLLAQVRARMSFTKTISEVVALRNAWPRIREVLIEDKANGPAVIDTLKASVSGIIPIEPDGSKLARAHAVTSYWEAGNVWLPHPDTAPWVKDLVAELTAFPASANDDQVDAMTQALRRLYPLFNRLKISQAALDKAMGRS